MCAKRILWVEGTDDEHVLKHLCGRRSIPHLDEIKKYGGVNELLSTLYVQLKASQDGDIVGVVLDADVNIGSRWQSLQSTLISLGYEDVTNAPLSGGSIFDPPDQALLPRVGIWLMPDNRSDGILEDFLRFLVPSGSQLFEHVEKSVASIPEEEIRFGALARPKAIIHTWLAWQQEPGKPLGTSITARYLDSDVAQVDELISWLKQLYFS